jgi:hypothetical protein
LNALFPDLPARPVAEEGSDVAYTPDAVAFQCVAFVVDLLYGRRCGQFWAEPCAGDGAFARAMESEIAGPSLVMELDPKAASVRDGIAVQGDALIADYAGVEVIITNPPFSIAAQLLRVWLKVPTMQTIALLLRRDWIVPEGQGDEHRLDLCWGPFVKIAMEAILYPRVPFGGPGRDEKGTDTREYSLFVWQRQPDGTWRAPSPMQVYRLDWRTGVVL